MLLIRTGGSSKTGFGHLTRMQKLASLLKSDTEIIFCIDRDKNAIKYMQEGNFPFCTPKDIKTDTLDQLTGAVIDLREISSSEISLIGKLKKRGLPIMQITDLGLSPAPDIDITVDSSIRQLITDKNPEKKHFKGPKYAILHHRFRHFNKVKRKYNKKGNKIFICLGGGAKYEDIRILTDILTRHNFKIKIAPGFCMKKSAIKTLRRIYPGIRFTGKPDSLARSFFEADIAIIAPGVAAFESACCGTPAIYLSHNEEQEFAAQTFENSDLGLNFGKIKNIEKDLLIKKITDLNIEARIRKGAKGKKFVDGLGLHRIIDLIKEHRLI